MGALITGDSSQSPWAFGVLTAEHASCWASEVLSLRGVGLSAARSRNPGHIRVPDVRCADVGEVLHRDCDRSAVQARPEDLAALAVSARRRALIALEVVDEGLNSTVSDSRTPSAPSTKVVRHEELARSPMRSGHRRARKYRSYKLFLFIPDDYST